MSARVLLVDDEVHILRAAEFKLRRNGYEVCCAFDGEEAWTVIQNQRPDVLITDQQMPRLSGTELIARLRQYPEYEDLPVFLLTAKGFELAPREELERLGIREVIPKPFSPRELCRRVDVAIEQRAPTNTSLAL
jgi:two-component system alkaline phosphatase synthesis response regulator PhoP